MIVYCVHAGPGDEHGVRKRRRRQGEQMRRIFMKVYHKLLEIQ